MTDRKKLHDIIEEFADDILDEATSEKLCDRIYDAWMRPTLHMSCTVYKPCGEEKCALCKSKQK